MGQIETILKYATPAMMGTFMLAVAVFVVYQMVFKGFKFVRPNGNGKQEKGNDVAEIAEKFMTRIDRFDVEIKAVGEKVDNLKLEIAGNYARRESLDKIREQVDDLRERTVKTETLSDANARQIREIFSRLNK